ncbi:MAG: phosphodiester glycosidase family protein [Lachnospiraceae bacterium]|nr:phosphodiester glycosidase family protein [Lachnospiraceae bacterium]
MSPNRNSKKNSGKSSSPLKTILHVIVTILITLAFLLIAVLGVIFILEKGPSETAKVLFVKSCDETSRMKWVPHIFLKDEEVKKILSSSDMAEVDNDVVSDSDKINVTETSQDIEILDVVGSSYKGKLMIVHDPSRVFCGTVESFGEFQGLVVQDIAARYDGVVGGVNGGDFIDMGNYSYTALPLGCVISNGEVVFNEYGYDEYYHIAGFTKDNKFFMGNVTLNDAIETYGIRDAVYTVHNTGPFLVMDGEALINEVPDSATYGGGKNPRTAIGQRADGAILLLVVDGRQADSLGATFKDLAYCMLEYGAVNACAMDGGTSSQMVYEGEVLNHPYSPTGPRKCPTAWLVK